MNRRGRHWRWIWRVGLGFLLLAWLLHGIFVKEAQEALARQDPPVAWAGLGVLDRWQAAWRHGPPELGRTMTEVRVFEGGLSLLFMGSTLFLGMLRWRLVLRVQGIDLSLARTTEISLVAHFFNSLLLGSTGGDLMKAYYAARETQHRKTAAVVTVVADRLIGLLSMLLFAAVAMGPNWSLLAGHPRLAALAGGIVVMLLAGLGIAGLSFWGGLSRHWPQGRELLRRLPKGELLEQALDACRRFGQEPVCLAQALGLSMILNVMCVLQVWALARGLGLSIQPEALFLIVPVIICYSALPITPSGLGVRENIYVAMLAVAEINVPATRALSLSLLAFAGSVLWSLVGGAVYLGLRGRHHLGELARQEPAQE